MLRYSRALATAASTRVALGAGEQRVRHHQFGLRLPRNSPLVKLGLGVRSTVLVSWPAVVLGSLRWSCIDCRMPVAGVANALSGLSKCDRARDSVTVVKAALFLILATLFWAGNFVFGAAALDSVDPISLTWIRWAFALIPLAIVAQLIEKPDWRAALRHLPLLTLLGVLGITGFSLLHLLRAAVHQPAERVADQRGQPGADRGARRGAARGAAGRQARAPDLARRCSASCSGLIGVVIVITDGDVLSLLRNGLNPGDLLMLGAIVAWSIYTLVGRRIHDVPPITSTAIQVAVGGGAADPVPARSTGCSGRSDGAGWGAVGYIVIFPSIGGVRALERGDPQGRRRPRHPSTSTCRWCSRR